MIDPRDPRVAELVTRLVEQAPPAPAFPDGTGTQRRSTRRRVAVAGVVFAVVLVVAVVLLVAWRPSGHSVVVTPSSTSVPRSSVGVIRPSAMAVGPDGTLYVSDLGAQRVVARAPNGDVRVVASLDQPAGLTLDHEGNLYVADDATNTVQRVDPDGNASTYAGNGAAGYAGDGGPATQARLSDPWAMAFGPDGALYISDAANERVRRVAPNGTITTVAGNGTAAITGDGGPALDAGLDPEALAFDGNGNLVVFHFSGKAVRRIGPDGVISSLPKPLYAAGFATMPDGAVAVADYGAFGISRIARDGTVSALPFRHDGVFRPVAIAAAPNGDLYVADDGGSGGGSRVMILLVHPDGTSVDVTPRGGIAPPSSDPIRSDRRVAVLGGDRTIRLRNPVHWVGSGIGNGVTATPDGRVVAYEYDTPTTHEIAMIDTNTCDAHTCTETVVARGHSPVFSAAGALAYIALDNGAATGPNEAMWKRAGSVTVRAPDGTTQVWGHDTGLQTIGWARDTLLVERDRPHADTEGFEELMIYRGAGDRTVLTQGLEAISPDGARLLLGGNGSDRMLELYDVATNRVVGSISIAAYERALVPARELEGVDLSRWPGFEESQLWPLSCCAPFTGRTAWHDDLVLFPSLHVDHWTDGAPDRLTFQPTIIRITGNRIVPLRALRTGLSEFVDARWLPGSTTELVLKKSEPLPSPGSFQRCRIDGAQIHCRADASVAWVFQLPTVSANAAT